MFHGLVSASLRRQRAFSSLSTMSPDVCILGGGPIGCELARIASIAGKDVVVVEKQRAGKLLAAPTGWVSKALRVASRELGESSGKKRVEWPDAFAYCESTAARALAMTSTVFSGPPLGVQIANLEGTASFSGPGEIEVVGQGPDGKETTTRVKAQVFFIATGSKAVRVPDLPWDDPLSQGFLYDSDTIVSIGRTPRHILIQGGGSASTRLRESAKPELNSC